MDYRLRGFFLLAWLNLRHYALALWGVGLKLDPDYPAESRFRGDLIVDSVLEYRLYGLFAPWCIVLACALPRLALVCLIASWTLLTVWRSGFYRTGFGFWSRAFAESPRKRRAHIRYSEECMLEIERRLKRGYSYDSPEVRDLVTVAMNLQNGIISQNR